jgi:hypothetical protein
MERTMFLEELEEKNYDLSEKQDKTNDLYIG